MKFDETQPNKTDAPVPQEPEGDAPFHKKKKSLIIHILLGLCIAGLVVAVVGLFLSTKDYRVASREYTQLEETVVKALHGEEKQVNFAALRQINPTVVGWLQIPNTNISYPVPQNKDDNNYYISRTFAQTYNPSGAVFLDARNNPDMTDTNSIFYGHNMKDGSMFAAIQSYATKKSYLADHPEITLYTPTATLVYTIFATRQTTIKDPAYQLHFEDKAAQTAFLQQMDPTLQPDDTVITLSTCVNDGDPQTPHRYIVQAVLTQETAPASGLPLPTSKVAPPP